jgi:hypothetical protein
VRCPNRAAGPRHCRGYALELFGADLEREPGAQPLAAVRRPPRAIRDSSRDLYRQHLERYWLGARRPGANKDHAPDIARVVADLAAREHEYLADRSIRAYRSVLCAARDGRGEG